MIDLKSRELSKQENIKAGIEKGLVSVVIPCYNCGKKIHRLFNSLLAQTYNILQIIVVNDGSIDESEKVILKYKKIFVQNGMDFTYIKQKNAGLGGAINTGIKQVTGEFMCWPDADDWLMPTSIEERKKFLDDHLDYGFVRSDAYMIFEQNLHQPIDYVTFKHPNRYKEEDLIEDYIWERNIVFTPGCHMVRTECFMKINPRMDIYPGRYGQNYQLLLPMLCFYKFGYLDRPLYNYVVYKTSLSKGDDCLDKVLKRYQGLEDIMIETFEHLPLPKEKKKDYIRQTRQKYHILKAKAAYDFGEKELFVSNFSQIENRYMTAGLIKASKIIDNPFMLSVHTYFYRIYANLKQSKLKYIYKRFKFYIISKKYNDKV